MPASYDQFLPLESKMQENTIFVVKDVQFIY